MSAPVTRARAGFQSGSWVEPADEAGNTEQTEFPSSGIFGDVYERIATQDVPESEVQFISQSPASRRSMKTDDPDDADIADTVLRPSKFIITEDDDAPVTTAPPKRMLCEFVDAQVAIMQPGELVISDISDNVIMKDTVLQQTFKNPTPQTMAAAYTELRKNESFKEFEKCFAEKLGTENGNDLRKVIIQTVGLLQKTWLHTDEQAITMIYLLIQKASKKNTIANGIFERVQDVFMNYQYTTVTERPAFLNAAKNGSLTARPFSVLCRNSRGIPRRKFEPISCALLGELH